MPALTLAEASIVSLLTFGLGLLLGHRLTLWRDRRVEFNAAAQPIRSYFLELIEKPWAAPFIKSPSVDALHEFEARLSAWKLRAFRIAYAGVRESAANVRRDEVGNVIVLDQDATTQRARDALKFVRIR